MFLLLLQINHARGDNRTIVELEAAEDSPLEDLSPRIKAAFSLDYTDHGYHSFQANGHIYVPDDNVSQVTEMEFETWEPSYPEQEEPDWHSVYRSSDGTPLNQVFTVLGSAVIYHQGITEIRITLADYI